MNILCGEREKGEEYIWYIGGGCREGRRMLRLRSGRMRFACRRLIVGRGLDLGVCRRRGCKGVLNVLMLLRQI